MNNVSFDSDKRMVTRVAIPPAAARATTTTGTSIDTARTSYGSQRTRSVVFVVAFGTITDGSYVITAEESDASGSGFTAIPANRLSNTTGTVAATADDTSVTLSCSPAKRYVRIVVTPTGATTGGIYSAVAILLPN